MSGLIPPIGATGLYKLAPPFKDRIDVNISYSCMAIRKLSDYNAVGMDPYKLYYEPNGISRVQYEIELGSGVCIVSLQSTSGIWEYVPSSYILAYPDSNGVSYLGMALMLSIGAVPESMDLSALSHILEDTTESVIGIRPTIKEVATTQKQYISQENHLAAETARLANMTSVVTNHGKAVALERDNLRLRDKINQLEQFILARMGAIVNPTPNPNPDPNDPNDPNNPNP